MFALVPALSTFGVCWLLERKKERVDGGQARRVSMRCEERDVVSGHIVTGEIGGGMRVVNEKRRTSAGSICATTHVVMCLSPYIYVITSVHQWRKGLHGRRPSCSMASSADRIQQVASLNLRSCIRMNVCSMTRLSTRRMMGWTV